MRIDGRLAQLGERRVRNAEAEGSNPLPSTNQQHRKSDVAEDGVNAGATAVTEAAGPSRRSLLARSIDVVQPGAC